MNRIDATFAESGEMVDSGTDGASLGIRQLFDILVRRWLLIAGITVVVLAAAIAGTFFVTPQFDATGRMRIDPTERLITGENEQRSNSPQADQSRLDTEVQIIRSRGVAEQVVRNLNLANNEDFVDRATYARGPEAVVEEAITSLRNRVDVSREDTNYIVNVTTRLSDPELAAAVTNELMQQYIDTSVRRRTGAAAQQSRFLDDRLNTLASELRQLEAQIASYRGRSGIVEGGLAGTVTDQQIAPLSTQLAQAEAQAAAARANLAAAREQTDRGAIGAVSSVLSSNVIADLQRQRAEALREKAEIDARYGDRHPESIRVTQQLTSIDQSLREEARRIVAGLESTARSAEASAASLRNQLAQLRGQQAADNRASVTAESLEREAKAKQALYEQLSLTAQRTGEEQRNRESSAVIIEQAVPPLEPSVPNKPLFAVLGAIMGIILGLAAALVVEFMTSVIRTADDIEYHLRIPFITSVPYLNRRALRGAPDAVGYVVDNPMSSFAEAMRAIRNSLMLDAREPRVIAVLSSLPGEGKTTTSVGLGRIMAISGDSVILVDCDERRGGLKGIGVEGGHGGVGAVLRGEARAADEIIQDDRTGMHILPMRTAPSGTVDLFSGAAMRKLIDELRTRYRFVILDNAPTLAVADSRIVAALADTSIFVIKAEQTAVHAARAALGLLRQDGSDVMGAVLSMASVGRRRLGKRDPSYYYHRYREYRDD
ncbi:MULTISPECIES: GumC family protein [unclassified Sphingomonas]|jgi:capsular exopolysaccharide synthesis family protein|uniref:GumC family protein n=1 Tax=unclassified Sphingomonas TaxID=196159 RepID=UPI00083056C7|nr:MULTISPECIES: polysaccharide biosynthesis tyrosine autokinase [unclassified Sphingomonas]